MNWKRYEAEIHQAFMSIYPSAKILADTNMAGRFSRVDRQIDVLIDDQTEDYPARTVVDAKCWNKKIDVSDVETFIGLLRDVNTQQGIMVSPLGYSKAAFNRAYYDDTELDLEVLSFRDLQMFQAFGAIPFSGGNAVILPAPFGWIVDGSRRENMVASLYQRGCTFEEAVKAREWMYVNFWAKDHVASDIHALANHQEQYLRDAYPGARIEYKEFVQRKDAKSILRVVHIRSYPTPEYTAFVEFPRFIVFCVLFTPPELEKKNLRKLAYIIRSLIPGTISESKPEPENTV